MSLFSIQVCIMLRRLPTILHAARFNSTIAKNSISSADEDSIQQYSLEESQINEIKKAKPELARIPFEDWQTIHNIFSEYGFKTRNFVEIISNNPKLLTRPVKKIQESLEEWRGFQFGETRVEQLIFRYPFFLDIPVDRKIQLTIHTLKSFVQTSKNVWILLMNSPNLLQEDIKTIEAKFDYLQNVMRLEVSEIVKSEVFSFTLDEIKTRHVFLERLGLFKPRSPKAPPGEISKNPRLHQIMDPSENKFASKVASVTLAEFDAFKELYKRELDKRRDKASDESDDEI